MTRRYVQGVGMGEINGDLGGRTTIAVAAGIFTFEGHGNTLPTGEE